MSPASRVRLALALCQHLVLSSVSSPSAVSSPAVYLITAPSLSTQVSSPALTSGSVDPLLSSTAPVVLPPALAPASSAAFP